ncbi:MAG: hypothetical protein ACAI44_05150 [Candidatus Sericytochromatia bacterium]
MRTPALAELLAWLRRCSPEITPQRLVRLRQPDLTLAAVLHDLWLELFGRPLGVRQVRRLSALYLPASDPDRQLFSGLLLGLWLLQSPALKPLLRPKPLEEILLRDYLPLLQALPPASLFRDPERSEELTRFWLRALKIQPLDESPEDSAERWEYVSSQRRQELFAQLRQRRKRQEAIRQARERKQKEW